MPHFTPQRSAVPEVNYMLTPEKLRAQTQDTHDRLREEESAIETQIDHLQARLKEIQIMRSATGQVLDVLGEAEAETSTWHGGGRD